MNDSSGCDLVQFLLFFFFFPFVESLIVISWCHEFVCSKLNFVLGKKLKALIFSKANLLILQPLIFCSNRYVCIEVSLGFGLFKLVYVECNQLTLQLS